MKNSQRRISGITPAMLVAEISGRGMLAGTPDAILASESAGQAMLVQSELLPAKFQRYWDWSNGNKWELLERIGILVDQSQIIDGLFYRATLPTGWKKVASNHSMWSYLVDAHGRRRASLFYKAAFYDREAFWSLNCRYTTSDYYTGETSNRNGFSLDVHHAFVLDCAYEPHEDDVTYTQWSGADKKYRPTLADRQNAAPQAIVYVPDVPENEEDYLPDTLEPNPDNTAARCRVWLATNKPTWEDPTAYWDE